MASALTTEVGKRNELMKNLKQLSGVIGARPTGTPALGTAHQWAEERFNAYGLQNVRRETYDCGRAWSPGPTKVRLIAPITRDLKAVQFSWTPGTKGLRRTSLVQLPKQPSLSEDEYMRLRDKVILLDKPGAQLPTFSHGLLRQIRTARPTAILVASDTMYHLAGSWNASIAKNMPFDIPIAALDREDSAYILGLWAQGARVEIEIDLGGTYAQGPCRAFNTLAEIPGIEKPEEIVLVGAHLDSVWASPGASDNGAGVVVVMEAARALNALNAMNAKIRRSIRFVLFSGEEQGFQGSTAYLQAHEATVKNHQAVLILDSGGGRILGFGPPGWKSLQQALAKGPPVLRTLGMDHPIMEYGSSDQTPFMQAGIPSFLAIQEGLADYLERIHSPRDTMDRVSEADLRECANTVALTTLELANMKERLPHR